MLSVEVGSIEIKYKKSSILENDNVIMFLAADVCLIDVPETPERATLSS